MDPLAHVWFLPRNAYALRNACAQRGVCYEPVSVCLSVTRRCCIETAERIERVFGTKGILHRVVAEFECLQNDDTSLWTFSQTVNLAEFSAFMLRHVDRRKRCLLSPTDFVCNTFTMTKRRRRAVPLRQLRLVPCLGEHILQCNVRSLYRVSTSGG